MVRLVESLAKTRLIGTPDTFWNSSLTEEWKKLKIELGTTPEEGAVPARMLVTVQVGGLVEVSRALPKTLGEKLIRYSSASELR